MRLGWANVGSMLLFHDQSHRLRGKVEANAFHPFSISQNEPEMTDQERGIKFETWRTESKRFWTDESRDDSEIKWRVVAVAEEGGVRKKRWTGRFM